MKRLLLLIQKIILEIRILQIKLAIKLLKQKRTVPNLDSPTRIIIHHGGGWLDFDGVNRYHEMIWGFRSSLGYYAGYTYFIERDGEVIQARRDNEEGAHTKGFNKRTIGIGLMGNGVEKDFTPQQYESLEKLTRAKMKQYQIPRSKVRPHSAFAATLCPSDYLRNWILAL